MSTPSFFERARLLARPALLVVHAIVAVTAIAGGAVMTIGSFFPDAFPSIAVPGDYLSGSPFTSYLVPGLLLALLVGGLHAAAFVAQLRRTRYAWFWSAVAAFDILIWIFVQMTIIPFSFLQLAYFGAGVAEAGLVMLGLGVLTAHSKRDAAA